MSHNLGFLPESVAFYKWSTLKLIILHIVGDDKRNNDTVMIFHSSEIDHRFPLDDLHRSGQISS